MFFLKYRKQVDKRKACARISIVCFNFYQIFKDTFVQTGHVIKTFLPYFFPRLFR